MELFRHIWRQRGALIIGGMTIGASVVAWKYLHKENASRQLRICGKDYPKDTIIIHEFPRTKTIPNLGHFVMKLETYLRKNNIPFQPLCDGKLGPKGKIPWIEYNGIEMGDSQLIIEFLNKEFNIDMDKHLSKQERATAWAIQKWLEEFTYWINVYTRWVILADDMDSNFARYPNKKAFLEKLKGKLYLIGIGRHSNEEVGKMMVQDLRQFSVLLGEKKFIMGDEMSQVDCAAFGILSEVRWATPTACPGVALLQEAEMKNVVDYLDRIKLTYWPDWDDIPGTNLTANSHPTQKSH